MQLRALVICGLALAAYPGTADAATGWYLGLGAGWSTLNSAGYRVPSASPPLSGKMDFGDNAVVDLTGGYRFEMPIRLESEIQFADYSASQIQPQGQIPAPLSGDVSNLGFFVNAIYDMPVSRLFGVSLGFGLGADQVDPAIAGAGFRISNSRTAFAWQLLAGLSTPISDQMEVALDYRYRQIDGSTHDFLGAQSYSVSLGNKNTQSVMLSLRWFVGG